MFNYGVKFPYNPSEAPEELPINDKLVNFGMFTLRKTVSVCKYTSFGVLHTCKIIPK